MKLKQRPEDFVVREGFRFDDNPAGTVWVYRMDKQKVSTLAALERLSKEFAVRRRNLSVCGLKDKQGRTEQLVGVQGGSLGETEVVQTGEMRLTLLGRSLTPISSSNITSNRFEVTVRDLSEEEARRVPESVKEVERTGVVNYFDSQRFGFLKHGQGFIARHLIKGDWEAALQAYLATPSELDHSDDAKVKTFWKNNWGNFRQHAPQEAGKKYAPILRKLREDPTDFRGAFMHIETRQRMMTLFELQSFLWNEGVKRYLSTRISAGELVGLRYQAGALVFPRSLTPEQKKMLHTKTFPLLASDSKFDDEEVRTAALAALSAQSLSLGALQIPNNPALFFKHEERPMFVNPGKLRVNDPRTDELNKGKLKVNLSFTLPPGAYASLVVRRVLWFAVDGSRQLGPQGEELRTYLPGKKLASGKAKAAAQLEAQEEREQRAKPGTKPFLGQKPDGGKQGSKGARDAGKHEAAARKGAHDRRHASLAPAAAKPEKAAAGKPEKAGPAWGRPLGEKGPGAAAAPVAAPRMTSALAPAEVEHEEAQEGDDEPAEQAAPVAEQPRGFLARQRAKKAAKQQRRATETPKTKKRK